MHENSIHTIWGLSPIWLATFILVFTYAVIISERFNRAIVALIGAALVIGTGVLTQEQAIHGIDFNTIGLLFGMMVLVVLLERTGFFPYLGIFTAKKTRGNPWLLLVALGGLTSILSMILDNVTTIILIAPVTIIVARMLSINPTPILLAEAILSNVGGGACERL